MKYSIVFFICFFLISCCYAGVRGTLKKGNTYYKKGLYKEALEKYEIAENPKEKTVVANNKALAYYRLGDLKKSETEFIRALSLKGDNKQKSDINYNLGNLYKNQDEKEKALEYYKKALLANPDNIAAKNNLLALIKQKQQKHDQQKQNKEKDNKDKDKKNKKDNSKQQQSEKNKKDDSKNNGRDDKISKEDAERILKMLEEQNKADKDDEKTNLGVLKVDKNW